MVAPTAPAPPAGTTVSLATTKHGGRPHWRFDAVLLGSDAHGDWLGVPAGAVLTRPGATYVAPTGQVVLVPGAGTDLERAWLATFHAVGGPLEVYVDVTTPPVWRGSAVHTVDLDLDVLRWPDGRVRVDDEDEFSAHRVTLGYPPALCELALGSCARVRRLVAAGAPPYDGSARAWLDRL